ncbi:MAG: NAD+ synthase [Proteobacteria bacterium]|nr:NAD+ synthase [Pseudomonadota bacterium]
MTKVYRIAVAQINTTVGDLEGNCKKMKDYVEMAADMKADIAVFPELAITGYPPEDLLLKPKFIEDNLKALQCFYKSVGKIVVVCGFVDRKDKKYFNAAAIIYNGKVSGVYHKMLLPNYGVFDEKRHFISGEEILTFIHNGLHFGVNICEDIWHRKGPTKIQAAMGAQLILNINASPYHAGKAALRTKIVKEEAKANKVSIVYANLVGGQDELVFDGQSMIVNADGRVIARALPFKEDLLLADLPVDNNTYEVYKQQQADVNTRTIVLPGEGTKEENRVMIPGRRVHRLNPITEIYQALLLGIGDYVKKNGFQKVALGLSGGIDSAIVAALAVDALGSQNVVGVFMPSRYTSEESVVDANGLALNLGIKLHNIPIEGIYSAYLLTLSSFFEGLSENVTEENIQARIRGNILMALSNKFGWLVLTTGNKSEMSVGYATLYGDMAGGFAVIKDVPKTLVYEIARYRNKLGMVIPERVIIKEPTAELKPDQKDSDTLPPYEMLDKILKAYIEEDKHAGEISSSIAASGFIEKTFLMVDNSEYKRRQSPIGIKITPKAFGKDRRMPITNKYRG